MASRPTGRRTTASKRTSSSSTSCNSTPRCAATTGHHRDTPPISPRPKLAPPALPPRARTDGAGVRPSDEPRERLHPTAPRAGPEDAHEGGGGTPTSVAAAGGGCGAQATRSSRDHHEIGARLCRDPLACVGRCSAARFPPRAHSAGARPASAASRKSTPRGMRRSRSSRRPCSRRAKPRPLPIERVR